MSVPGPGGAGQFGAYVPPPPPPAARRSPWLYVALGCGGLLLLGFVGCIGTVAVVGNKFKAAMNQPLDRATLEKELADVPKYPGSKMDEKGTKAAGAVFGMMKSMILKPGQNMTFAAYATPDDTTKILPWYDKAMVGKGFKRLPGKERSATAEQHMYRKGDVIVIVQLPDNARTADYILMRMKGLDEEQASGFSAGSGSGGAGDAGEEGGETAK